jgi:putative sugar O-methyltransferase
VLAFAREARARGGYVHPPAADTVSAMSEQPSTPASVADPSRFWSQLGAEHERQLAEHGLDAFKRKQALRYFTWRWRPRHMLRSEQLRFLARNSSPQTWGEVLREPIDLDDELWRDCGFSRGERRMTVIATRLIWAYAELHGSPQVLALEEPELGSPLPVRWRGRLISQDLANCALELRAIERALQGRTPASIVEIGGGYGRSAYALLSRFPEATYTIVDIDPARTISSWYLSQLFDPERLRFVAPDEAGALADGAFDLAVSISSLQEMTPAQVAEYLTLLDRTAAGGTVYLKQWETWRNPADDVELRFRDYPVPARWERVLDEPAPVQTRFVQAAWRLP